MNEDHRKPDEDAVDLYSKTQGATDGRKPSGQDPSAEQLVSVLDVLIMLIVNCSFKHFLTSF